MATQQIFSIYDRKAAAYMQPFFSANVETAKRSVTDSLQSNPVQHVADYDLFLIGVARRANRCAVKRQVSPGSISSVKKGIRFPASKVVFTP